MERKRGGRAQDRTGEEERQELIVQRHHDDTASTMSCGCEKILFFAVSLSRPAFPVLCQPELLFDCISHAVTVNRESV